MHRTFALCTVAMILWTVSFEPTLHAIEGASNLAEEALMADDAAAAETAFTEQARDDAHRAHLAVIVDRLASVTRAAWHREETDLAAALEKPLDADSLAALATAAAEHRTAAKAALQFIFNDKQYPVPAEATAGWRPGIDVQPGQSEMEKRYAEAAAKYAVLERAYHARLLQFLAVLKPGDEKLFADDPQPPLPEYLAQVEKMRQLANAGPVRQPGQPVPAQLPDPTQAGTSPGSAQQLKLPASIPIYALRAPDLTLERVLGLIAEKSRLLRLYRRKADQLTAWQTRLHVATDGPAPAAPASPATPAPSDPFADLAPIPRAWVALAEEDYIHAAAFAATKPQPAHFAWFWQTTACHALLIQNRNRQGLQPQDNWSLREINLYRLSLAELPLAINDKLQAAARKHGEAMQKKKFMGHFDADPAHSTPAIRAQMEGYHGTIGEDIAGGQDGTRSLWRWRSDAGHHRVLVLPSFCEAGLAEVDDKETLDVGEAAEAGIWKLFGGETPNAASSDAQQGLLPAGQNPSRPHLLMEP